MHDPRPSYWTNHHSLFFTYTNKTVPRRSRRWESREMRPTSFIIHVIHSVRQLIYNNGMVYICLLHTELQIIYIVSIWMQLWHIHGLTDIVYPCRRDDDKGSEQQAALVVECIWCLTKQGYILPPSIFICSYFLINQMNSTLIRYIEDNINVYGT
jgi:hypothetical protein